MSDYKLEPKSIVDELAQYIRQVDGNNKMGAGALADKICERFHVNSPDVQGEPTGLTDEQIFSIAEPFGAFEFGDAQGDKTLAFARAILAAHRKGGSDDE